MTLAASGRYEEAEALHWEALELSKDVRRAEHLDTVREMHRLALVWHALGKFESARALMGQAADLQSDVFGPSHPDTIESVTALASWQQSQDEHNVHEVLDDQEEAAGVTNTISAEEHEEQQLQQSEEQILEEVQAAAEFVELSDSEDRKSTRLNSSHWE